jgi:hypothetical protein
MEWRKNYERHIRSPRWRNSGSAASVLPPPTVSIAQKGARRSERGFIPRSY